MANLHAIVSRVKLPVGARARALDPGGVFLIPRNRFAETALPRLARAPPEFGLNSRRINCVTEIVTRAIPDGTDQRVRLAQRVEHRPRHLDVEALVARADVVSRARAALFQRQQNR